MEINIKEIKPVFDAFVQQTERKFADYFEEKIREQNNFIAAFSDHYGKLSKPASDKRSLNDLVQLNQAFKHNLLTLIIDHQQKLKAGDFNGFFQDFITASDLEINKLNEFITAEEEFKKYTLRKDDNFLLLIRKTLINMKLRASHHVKSLRNRGRRLFRKTPVSPSKKRKRNIPLMKMARYFLVEEFAEKTMDQLSQILKWQSLNLLKLWSMDDEIDASFQLVLSADHPNKVKGSSQVIPDIFFDQLIIDNNNLLNDIRSEIRKVTNRVFESFEDALRIVDTLELPASTFKPDRLEKKHTRINVAYGREFGRWKNAHFTLFDDWAVDLEITSLYYSVYDKYNQLKSKIDKFLSLDLDKRFAEIESFINASIEQISQSPDSAKSVKEILIAEREKINNKLIDKILTRSIEKLTDCFSADFNNFSASTHDLVMRVSDRRGFIKSKDYERGIRDSEISFISPQELLKFEALPNFRKKVSAIQETIETRFEKVRFALFSLGRVSDFSLESSLILVDKEKRSGKDAMGIAVQGYERALNQLNTAKDIITGIQTVITIDLRNAVNIYYADVQKLKNTENVFDLNLKIAQIKAMERSKRVRQQTLHYLRTFIPETINLLNKTSAEIKFRIKDIRNRIGIPTDTAVASYELSEFIGDTATALKKLPFVYQRLYQLQPTDEDRFFVNREKELILLMEAYKNWTKDRFVTIAVIGEKGSGTTSLINYFLRKIESDIQTIRHTLNEKVYTGEQYFNLFNTLLKTDGFNSNQQFIDSLNKAQGTQIIILENLQHMFLKKVNGFDGMKMLFELISHTQKKVMWIGVYTPVTWEYLDKTISVSNYFTDEIRLQQLSDDIIKEIIFKRNSLSGYQIQFTPTELNLQSKLFQKLDQEQQQLYLQKQFFSNLNRLSNGNISLAQMYWLRSTRSVDEKSIIVSIVGGFDLSFVKNLPGNFLFALQVLLLHDGLTLEDFSQVMNQPENVSRNLLIPMLEKGLLIRPKHKLNINPIIYKHVLAYLSSRNFIH
jgi:predicted RNA-binding protein with EMAP domain